MVSEPSVHSAFLLADYFLGQEFRVDAVLVIGPCALNKGDQDQESDSAPLHEAPDDSGSDLVNHFVAEGGRTSVLSQLENLSRVCYLNGPNDRGGSCNLTVHSSSINESLVEVAPGLFVSGLSSAQDGLAVDAFLGQALQVIAASKEGVQVDEPEPALLLLSTNHECSLSPNQMILHCFPHDRGESHLGYQLGGKDCSPPHGVAASVPISESLKYRMHPLWSSGKFLVVDADLRPPCGDETRARWVLASATEAQIDISRHCQLPTEL